MREIWILDALAAHETGGRVTLASLGEVTMYGEPLGTSTDFDNLTSQLREVPVEEHPVLDPNNTVPRESRFFEPTRFYAGDGSSAYVWLAEYRRATPNSFFGNSAIYGRGAIVTHDPQAKSDLRPVFVQNHLTPHGHRNPREEDRHFGRLVSEIFAVRQTGHIVHSIERAGNGQVVNR
jgi:hypothetical protein